MTSKEIQCIQAANDFQMFYARKKLEKLLLIFDQCKQKMTDPPQQGTKTVLALWHIHGIDKNRYGEHRAIRLLNQWLDVLYGEGIAKELNIEGRCSQKWQNNIQINMPFYTEANAPHFHFRNPFNCVIEEISGELSPNV